MKTKTTGPFDPVEIHLARMEKIVESATKSLDASRRAKFEDVLRGHGVTAKDFVDIRLEPSRRMKGSPRSMMFEIAKDILGVLGLEGKDLAGPEAPTKFTIDRYTRWPLYTAAMIRVVQGSHELHVVPAAPEGPQDLQQDLAVRPVPRAGGGSREGDLGSDRGGEAVVPQLAGTAHPRRRASSRRKRNRHNQNGGVGK